MSRDDAHRIADAFVLERRGRPLPHDGSQYVPGDEPRWEVYYKNLLPGGDALVVVDPSHVIVLVNVRTRTASWFHTM